MNLLQDGIKLHRGNFTAIGQQIQPYLEDGKCFRMVLKPWRERRSLSQNALSHMWYSEISEYLISRGKTFATPAWVTQWAWNEFKALLGTRKIASKTLERLKKLIWLAAQDVKSELAGRETYEYRELASLVGVTSKNWSETFTERWVAMKHIFLQLDSEALLLVTRTRSKQKTTFSQQSIAKLD
ncbi:hypothetical protein FPZ27_12130 [Escherichia coli]|nr:hypothetical protein [Escherichia coli]